MKGSIWESRFGPHRGERIKVLSVRGRSVLVKSIGDNHMGSSHPESRYVKIERLRNTMKRIK